MTVSFFHANYVSKQIYNTGIQQNIFLANKNRSSNIDIYLTLFLSPNSSEGRAWANKILLARYIKPEKIDYDNVNMFK